MAKYINDNGEYYNGGSLTIDGSTYISPSEDIILAAGYHVYVPTAEELLEQARSRKLADIMGYDSSNAVNIFYLAGTPMWLDAATRQQLRISIEAYQAQGAETVTKWFGGQQFTFPTALWLTMLNALEVYAAEALNVTEAHKAAVSALTTVDDIVNYDHTAGYPEVLNLTPEWLASLS